MPWVRVPDEPKHQAFVWMWPQAIATKPSYRRGACPRPDGSDNCDLLTATMNFRRINPPRTAAILGLILLSLPGCKYDRSFMNMDSNSGSPFFGLQLAVDTGTRPPVNRQPARDDDQPTSSHRRYPPIPDHRDSASGAQVPVLLTRSAATKLSGFERTSDARELTTNVRYSLQAPPTEKSLQTQAIDLRLSAF